jgi:PAS domain S-box-containing protein
MLAGALSFTQRSIPTWLLPGALLVGLVRAAMAQEGFVDLANGIALGVEPALLLVAAWLTRGAGRAPLSSAALRLLPAAFVLLALQEALTAVLWIHFEDGSRVISAGWVVVGPLALALQILALSARGRAALRSAYAQLERRVEERTRALRESEERFRRLAAMSFEGIVIHERGTILEVNPALTALLGYPSSALVGSPLARLFVSQDQESIQARTSEAFEGILETTGLRSDGSTFPAELEVRSVIYGGRAQWVCAVRDISQRRNAERELDEFERRMRETQKLESLGVLAAGIAHDFNNLLTVMMGHSWVALEDLDVDSPVRARIHRVRGAGEQAAKLVEQLLTYSGKSSAKQVPLDLSRLVVEMLDLLRVSVTEKCELVPDLEGDIPAVDADPSQMRQVILNLVLNAAEAMKEGGGQVTIRTGSGSADASDLANSFGSCDLPSGRVVFLEVSDTGPGIREEIRARIFEPFFTTKRSGRGLGLASVLGIVRAHAGAIVVESEPTAGSRFRVILPTSD